MIDLKKQLTDFWDSKKTHRLTISKDLVNYKNNLVIPPEISRSGQYKEATLFLELYPNQNLCDVVDNLFSFFQGLELPIFNGVQMDLKITSIDWQEKTKDNDIYQVNIWYCFTILE